MKLILKSLFLFALALFSAPLITSGNPVIATVTIIADGAFITGLVMPYVNNGTFAMNNIDARMVFENAKDALVKAFGTDRILDVVKLTQGSLRFEQPLVAGQTVINFPVLDNQAVFSNTEDRLLLQDSFVISSIKIATGAPSSSVDNTWMPDSYPNVVKYGAANADALNAFWNSTNLQIAVNNDIITPKWDVYRHYNAPETQQTAALGAGSPADQDRGSFDGWYPVEPNIVLIGQKNTTMQIQFKQGSAGLAAILANSRAIIMVRGVLAQNSTVVS